MRPVLSEPAKPVGLTGLQGWPVRSANFFEKTGFFSRPGMEPAGTGRTGSGLGTQETQFFFKNQKIDNVSQTYDAFHLSPLSTLLTKCKVQSAVPCEYKLKPITSSMDSIGYLELVIP